MEISETSFQPILRGEVVFITAPMVMLIIQQVILEIDYFAGNNGEEVPVINRRIQNNHPQ
jgi:hypothetical protein